MSATGRTTKRIKEAEAEDAIVRQAADCHVEELIKAQFGRRSIGRCIGCAAPGPGLCDGCGAYITDEWVGG